MTSIATAEGAQVETYAFVSPEAQLALRQVVRSGPPAMDEPPRIIRTIELRERPFAPVLDKLAAFATLPPDWDSYGAAVISARALSTARAILSDLSFRSAGFGKTSLVPFTVAPVATGGINIEWRGRGAALELWIGADGSMERLLDRRYAEPRFEEKALNGIPAAVAEVLAFAAA